MLQEKQLYAVLTEMVQLDAYEDHGILATNEKPLMTCSDCEVNKNIYLFGTCKCGNIYSPYGKKGFHQRGSHGSFEKCPV